MGDSVSNKQSSKSGMETLTLVIGGAGYMRPVEE